MEFFCIFLLSFYFFLFGLWGLIVVSSNLIILIISLEFMIVSVNVLFILFSAYLDDMVGQVYSLMVLTVAAGEISIGLSLLVCYYKLNGVVSLNYLSYLNG